VWTFEAPAMLRHVVLFRFRPDAQAEAIRRIEAEFAALPDRIEHIRGFEWGHNTSPEGLDKGFTHAFVVSFADDAGRDAYLPHPAHQAFVAQLKPLLDDVLVIDYDPREITP
jgi:quinol monooxygenase YgiN